MQKAAKSNGRLNGRCRSGGAAPRQALLRRNGALHVGLALLVAACCFRLAAELWQQTGGGQAFLLAVTTRRTGPLDADSAILYSADTAPVPVDSVLTSEVVYGGSLHHRQCAHDASGTWCGASVRRTALVSPSRRVPEAAIRQGVHPQCGPAHALGAGVPKHQAGACHQRVRLRPPAGCLLAAAASGSKSSDAALCLVTECLWSPKLSNATPDCAPNQPPSFPLEGAGYEHGRNTRRAARRRTCAAFTTWRCSARLVQPCCRRGAGGSPPRCCIPSVSVMSRDWIWGG